MALTRNLKRIGMAAHIERMEMQAFLEGESHEAIHRFTVQYRWTLRCLMRLDPEWEWWYDNRPEQTCGQMLPLMQERICELQFEQEPAFGSPEWFAKMPEIKF